MKCPVCSKDGINGMWSGDYAELFIQKTEECINGHVFAFRRAATLDEVGRVNEYKFYKERLRRLDSAEE